MAQLKLYFFGPPRVVQGNQVVNINLRKASALLAYLVTTGKPHSRESLATLLWPDSDLSSGRASLRRTLYQISQALGNTFILTTTETLSLDPAADFWLDVAEYRASLETALAISSDAEPTALTSAITLYTDHFLAGFTLPDCQDFDEWQFFEREGLRQLQARALKTLVSMYQSQADYDRAIGFARRWLALDTLHEPTHAALMQLYDANGQQSAAVRQYEECVRILQEEVGVSPTDETTTLFEAIKGKRLVSPLLSDNEQIDRVKNVLSQPESPLNPSPKLIAQRHNLSAQPTPFVGRKQALLDIIARLVDPDCRLLTLTGPGGIGKTRLAIEAARQVAANVDTYALFQSGIWFVSFVAADTVPKAVAAITQALNISLQGSEAPETQLITQLQSKNMLLILDNAEDLLPHSSKDGQDTTSSISIISDMIAHAPNVKLLVTSRETLNVRGEWVHALTGLSLPEIEYRSDAQEGTTSSDAVQLFVQNAQRMQTHFSLEDMWPDVVRICHLVEGMPLALELAASWLRTLPIETIACEIENGLDILSTQLHDVPARHRSIRAVFEHAWQMLSVSEQAVLMKLSAFRGGFRYAAAEAVAEASLIIMAQLVDKSLVTLAQNDRYQMHELLRQFAAEKLSENKSTEAETFTRHCQYYLRFIKDREQQLIKWDQQSELDEISDDIENIRVGWQWAVAQNDLAMIEAALDGMYHYFWIRGRGQEGQDLFATASAQLLHESMAGSSLSADVVLMNLWRKWGLFDCYLGQYGTASKHFYSSLEIARRLKRDQETVAALNALGPLVFWQGGISDATKIFQESLIICQQNDYKTEAADALHSLAQINLYLGDYVQAKLLAEDSLAYGEQVARQDTMAYALEMLGFITLCLGDYDQADSHYRQSLTLFEEIQHVIGASLAMQGLGSVAWANKEYNEALAATRKSLDLAQQVNNSLCIAGFQYSLARIYCDQGDYHTAQTHAVAGLSMAQDIDCPIFMAYNHCALAEVAHNLDDIQASQNYFSNALSFALKLQLTPALSLALFHISAMYAVHSQTMADPTSKDQHRIQALAMLKIITQHPATWHLYKARASTQIATLTEAFPDEIVEAAAALAQQISLEAMAQMVRHSLLADASNQATE